MNFEDYFRPEDEAKAELTLKTMLSGLKLVDSYASKGDSVNARRVSKELADALIELNKLLAKKNGSNQMYLHHLLTQPQGWYPH